MASELTLSASMRFAKGAIDVQFARLNQLFTVSGTDFNWKSQEIGTSEEAIALGDCAAGGYILIYNSDATNYVKIRAATGGTDMVRLKAGEFAMFRFDVTGAAAPFAIADTAAVICQYLLVEP